MTSFGHMRAFNSLGRALSAVSQVWGRTGLKTRVIISDILPALSAVKAGSVFFWRICTSVVNLAPALRAPLHLSNLNSITSPIIVEAVGVIPCLLCNLRV